MIISIFLYSYFSALPIQEPETVVIDPNRPVVQSVLGLGTRFMQHDNCAGNFKIVLSFNSVEFKIEKLECGNKSFERHALDQKDRRAHEQTGGQLPILKTT